MELQSGSHISLMSYTFDGVKHVSRRWEYAWEWYADLFIVKLGIVSSIYGHFGEESGVEMHMCTLFPWLRFIKGIFAQVLAYAWFYKSEKIHKSSICAYVHF